MALTELDLLDAAQFFTTEDLKIIGEDFKHLGNCLINDDETDLAELNIRQLDKKTLEFIKLSIFG